MASKNRIISLKPKVIKTKHRMYIELDERVKKGSGQGQRFTIINGVHAFLGKKNEKPRRVMWPS